MIWGCVPLLWWQWGGAGEEKPAWHQGLHLGGWRGTPEKVIACTAMFALHLLTDMHCSRQSTHLSALIVRPYGCPILWLSDLMIFRYYLITWNLMVVCTYGLTLWLSGDTGVSPGLVHYWRNALNRKKLFGVPKSRSIRYKTSLFCIIIYMDWSF